MSNDLGLNYVAYSIFIIELLGVMLITRATPRAVYDMCLEDVF